MGGSGENEINIIKTEEIGKRYLYSFSLKSHHWSAGAITLMQNRNQ